MTISRRAWWWIALAVVTVALAIDPWAKWNPVSVDFRTYLAAARVGLQNGWPLIYDQVLVAAGRLAQLPRTCCVSVSPVYVSRPHGPIAQPDFVNAAAGLLTQLSARELLDELRAIEADFSRRNRLLSVVARRGRVPCSYAGVFLGFYARCVGR